MAIGTYLQLRTAIGTWLHRSDLTSVAADFVTLAEASIRRDVRVRAQLTEATGTLSSTSLAVPSGLLEVQRFVIGTDLLTYVTPQRFYDYSDSDLDWYTIEGSNFTLQSSSGSYELDYWKAFDAFSADSDTNWLLTNHPDVYLFAALQEAAIYVGKDPGLYAARYQQALNNLRASEQTAAGPMTVTCFGVV